MRSAGNAVTFEYTPDEGRQRPARARAGQLMAASSTAAQMKDAVRST